MLEAKTTSLIERILEPTLLLSKYKITKSNKPQMYVYKPKTFIHLHYS